MARDTIKAEWLHDIQNGDCTMKGFLSIVGDSTNEREIRKFEEGLNSKVLYKTFNKVVEFKKYLHGKSDAGSRLMCKCRSGTHGLNEELGRHRGREGCDDECESVSHVLWECPALY